MDNVRVYKIDSLYMGLVEYLVKGKAVMDVHVLSKSKYEDEMYDLNLCQFISNTGDEEIYYQKSLIPMNDVLYASRVNWTSLSREDALKIGTFMHGKYMKFLNIKRLTLSKL